jgi:hypothetical protein
MCVLRRRSGAGHQYRPDKAAPALRKQCRPRARRRQVGGQSLGDGPDTNHIRHRDLLPDQEIDSRIREQRMDRTSGAGPRAKSVFVWLCVALLVTSGMSACSGPNSLPPLPVRHRPGVTNFPDFERFYRRQSGDFEHLNDCVGYQPNGPGTIGRVLVTAGIAGAKRLLDIGLDGSGGRKLADGGLCQERPAVN